MAHAQHAQPPRKASDVLTGKTWDVSESCCIGKLCLNAHVKHECVCVCMSLQMYVCIYIHTYLDDELRQSSAQRDVLSPSRQFPKKLFFDVLWLAKAIFEDHSIWP